MTFARGLALIADLVFLSIAASTLLVALRSTRRAHRDVAMFFVSGGITVLISLSQVRHPALTAISSIGLIALPVLLLRIVRDFTSVSRGVMVLSTAAFAISAGIVLALPAPLPRAAVLFIIGYIIVTNVYATVRFVAHSRLARGARKRRKQAVAVGTFLLAVLFLVAGLRTVIPQYQAALTAISAFCSLGCTVGYFLGFAPPDVVRRGWQHPGLTAMVRRLSEAPSARTFEELVAALEQALSEGFTAPHARIALWDVQLSRLVAPSQDRSTLIPAERANQTLAYRVFATRQPLFVDDASEADPANRDIYERFQAKTLLAVPITVRDDVIGVVTLFGEHPLLFAEDDLSTLTAVAPTIAAVIEGWQLTEKRSAASALEESLALEREFLAAAAHELRTPLTSILGESQLLERRLAGDSVDRALQNAHRITTQATRMRVLVNDLLSVARDTAGFVDELVPADVLEIARTVAEDFPGVHVAGEPIEAPVDAKRIAQVVRNLLDNARKYGPGDAPIEVRVLRERADVRIEVQDRGVGVSPAERDRIFDRFFRGAMMEHSTTEGMGLGLYLCRCIVEEHGGRIWVESSGAGSTFVVTLPLSASAGPPTSRASSVEGDTSEASLAGSAEAAAPAAPTTSTSPAVA